MSEREMDGEPGESAGGLRDPNPWDLESLNDFERYLREKGLIRDRAKTPGEDDDD